LRSTERCQQPIKLGVVGTLKPDVKCGRFPVGSNSLLDPLDGT
jgi:hypothetical protein